MNNAHPAQIFRHWSSVNFVQSFGFGYFFIHKLMATCMQGLNDAGQWMTAEKNQVISYRRKKTSPKSPKFSVVPALLSRLWWLSSSLLISTYTRGLNQDVLQRAVPKLQELCGYWEIWEAAVGWELPGSLWRCLWSAVVFLDGSLFLVDSGSLLWDTLSSGGCFLFAFNFLWCAASWRTGKA